MQKTYKTVIIGGGAAGLMAAVELVSGADALNGQEVLILERNDRVGKKLIATGNGQGNLMNERFGEEYYYGEKQFISTFVNCAKQINLEKYLFNLGIPLVTAKDGKMYPLSKQASSVLDTLRAYLDFKGVITQTSKRVSKIQKCDNGYEIFVDKEKCLAEKVVFATGGMAGKQFGTDGSAYKLVEELGHKKTATYPSLVQLKTQTDLIKGLKGLKETARVTAFVGGRPLKSATGDLLFTEFGVSGSTIFQVSACIAGAKDAYLIIEFLPDLTYSQTEKILLTRSKKAYVKSEDLLCGVLNKRIGQAVIRGARGKSIQDVAYTIKNFKLMVTGSLDFNYAQVTKGGIKTDKIEPKTLESRICPGLYLVGEVLDVDGDCGGYNLTFAFVSAILSARAIKDQQAKKGENNG